MMAKSLELCASGSHQTEWKFFNEGKLEADRSFRMREMCKTQPDFDQQQQQQTQQEQVRIHPIYG